MLIHAWGARGTLIATGLLLIACAALFLPSLRAIDRRISAPGADFVLLRKVSFFGPLPFATVEHLASTLEAAAYEPGDVIIREGEPGEHLYVIADGLARVSQDGRQLRELGAPDSFGEIGLLRQIPRTASVTAITRVEARILSCDDFLAAVTGNPQSVQAATEVASARLLADGEN